MLPACDEEDAEEEKEEGPPRAPGWQHGQVGCPALGGSMLVLDEAGPRGAEARGGDGTLREGAARDDKALGEEKALELELDDEDEEESRETGGANAPRLLGADNEAGPSLDVGSSLLTPRGGELLLPPLAVEGALLVLLLALVLVLLVAVLPLSRSLYCPTRMRSVYSSGRKKLSTRFAKLDRSLT